jgi:hypothetical protein
VRHSLDSAATEQPGAVLLFSTPNFSGIKMNPNDNDFDGIHSDFSNQTSYKHPKAWRDAKRAMINMANHLPEFVEQLEAVAREDKMCIRLALAAALYGYVNQTKSSRVEDFVRSVGGDPESGSGAFVMESMTGKPKPPEPASGDDDEDDDGPGWEKKGEEWKQARAKCPSESLPENERVSKAEFMAAIWKTMSALPIPTLPADAIITAVIPVDKIDGLPMVTNGPNCGKDWRMFCSFCGKAYRDTSALSRHMEKKHHVNFVEDGGENGTVQNEK